MQLDQSIARGKRTCCSLRDCAAPELPIQGGINADTSQCTPRDCVDSPASSIKRLSNVLVLLLPPMEPASAGGLEGASPPKDVLIKGMPSGAEKLKRTAGCSVMMQRSHTLHSLAIGTSTHNMHCCVSALLHCCRALSRSCRQIWCSGCLAHAFSYVQRSVESRTHQLPGIKMFGAAVRPAFQRARCNWHVDQGSAPS